MRQVFVRGTLGDSYTAGLKLLKNEEDVEIFHYTIHKYWYENIKEIYKMFYNIKKVNFIEFTTPDIKEIGGIPEKEMIWFPELYLPYIPLSYEKYIVIFPHAGREDAMARKISFECIDKMIELLDPIPVILLGTDEKYKCIKCHENLIGETSIIEATSLIIDSYGFCGPEGYPAFVALSHKIPSVIFWKRWQPVEARLLKNPWTSFIIDLIKI